jgi:hypothetical protein
MMLARWLDFGNMARQYPPPVAEMADQKREIEQMSVRRSLFAAATASILALAMAPASAQTLRYANQGDLKSLDPYTLNESTTHAHLGHVFEGLVARDRDLKIIPALAESWEIPEPTRWRFHLRKGVKFQNGDPFTADDVVFSAERVQKKGSNLQTRIPSGTKVVKVDDYTVDFILTAPIPFSIRNGIPGTSWTRSGPRRTTPSSPRPPRQRPRALPRSTPTAPAPSPSRAISPASRPSTRPTRTGGASRA